MVGVGVRIVIAVCRHGVVPSGEGHVAGLDRTSIEGPWALFAGVSKYRPGDRPGSSCPVHRSRPASGIGGKPSRVSLRRVLDVIFSPPDAPSRRGPYGSRPVHFDGEHLRHVGFRPVEMGGHVAQQFRDRLVVPGVRAGGGRVSAPCRDRPDGEGLLLSLGRIPIRTNCVTNRHSNHNFLAGLPVSLV